MRRDAARVLPRYLSGGGRDTARGATQGERLRSNSSIVFSLGSHFTSLLTHFQVSDRA